MHQQKAVATNEYYKTSEAGHTQMFSQVQS